MAIIKTKHYAAALADCLQGINDPMILTLTELADALKLCRELRNFFVSRTIVELEKVEYLQKNYKALSKKGINFVILLVRNGVLRYLPEIIDSARKISATAAAVIRVEIISAIPLDANDQNKLKEILKNKYAKSIETVCLVDERIIGGLVVKINEIVIDASVLGRLGQLGKALINQ